MRIRNVLVWGAALLFPFVFFLALASGFSSPLLAVLALVALLMPFPLVRRRPLAGLLVCLAGGVVVLFALGGRPALPIAAIAIIAFAAVDVALGVVAARRSRRVSLVTAVVTLAVEILVSAALSVYNVTDSSALMVLAVVT